jgi:glutamyl-tRNA(Gln) amidotransferase subunit E
MTKFSKSDYSSARPPGELNPEREPPLDFPDAEFGELKAADYQAIGFMSGLEVHQQLLTRSKLFCRCPAGRRVNRYDAEVLRHMRPTLSELGEYDGTALMEFKTRKEIVYQLERGTVCTYEMDDTPPFVIDEESVRVAVEIATLFNLNLVSELHVMRKQYLDGSIPTGFQRTAMLGLDGTIPFVVPELGIDRELRIRQLSLEEDSCREIADVGHRITFRTDRLGTPLTETVTEPDFLTPFEIQAGAQLLAHVVQATGKVRRGAGAARQDVNVSVAGGRRVELKGVDQHRVLPRLVHVEAFRQLNLLRIKAELERRGVTADLLRVSDGGLPWESSPNAADVGRLLKYCDYAPIQDALERGERAIAVRLAGFGGLLSRRTQPGATFAGEFSDRVRVIACPVDRPFLIHSDLRDYGLSPRQWKNVGKRLKVETGDALIVVWASEEDAATAVREIFIRAREALEGIPAETRQAFSDGTSGFERILPGPDRMYPDTDTPPVPIPDRTVVEIQSNLCETTWARRERYEKMGLDTPTAWRMSRAPWASLFDALAPEKVETTRRLASALEKRIPYHFRRKKLKSLPDVERLRPMVSAIDAGEIRPEAMERILDATLERPNVSAEDVLGRFRPRQKDREKLEELLADLVSRVETLHSKSPDAAKRWALGEVIPPFLGRFDPGFMQERVAEVLRETVTETQS